MKATVIKITILMASMSLLNSSYATPQPVTNSIPSQSMTSIQTVANKLMDKYNKHYKQPSKISVPKIKTPLPQCAVPLQASWPKEPEKDKNPYWVIDVKCTRTVSGAKVKNWFVAVPTNRPKTYVEQSKRLREMKSKADELMDSYNRQHKTDWDALEPNAKIAVPLCAVPLKARWQYVVSPIPPVWNVEVICTRTVKNDINMHDWTVLVPTERPRHSKYR